MVVNRRGAAVAMVVSGAMALTACANGSTGGDVTTQDITINYGYEQEFSSYNSNTIDGATSANVVPLTQVQRGFSVFDGKGALVPDTDFGTYKKTSDDPLTVEYNINDKAVWSDGNAIDCDDIVMAWLANSGKSNDLKAKVDPGWSAAATTGYEDMGKPACKDGDKKVTVTYAKKFVDWAAMFSSAAILPAHVVEKGSGVADLITAAAEPKGADSLKAAKFYNTGFVPKPGVVDKVNWPSSGPYAITAWQSGSSLTLSANPKWWGRAPKAKTIVLRYMAGDAMVPALQNGEIALMDPQPQIDLINQLKQAGDKVKFSTHDSFLFEHLDLNFKGVFADKNLRTAFAKCVPRDEIVKKLVVPQNPNAQIMDSRLIFPFQSSYAQVKDNGGQNYQAVDIAGATALVKGSGQKAPITVRLGWRKDPAAINQRRVDTVALIAASCKQAGINVVDVGAPDFFEKMLPSKSGFDVAMYAWQGTPLLSSNKSIYSSTGGQNNQNYSNAKVDADLDQLAQETDPTKAVGLVKSIDTQLWTDLATIPLFAHPGLMATTSNLKGAEFNPTNVGLTWNAYDWTTS